MKFNVTLTSAARGLAMSVAFLLPGYAIAGENSWSASIETRTGQFNPPGFRFEPKSFAVTSANGVPNLTYTLGSTGVDLWAKVRPGFDGLGVETGVSLGGSVPSPSHVQGFANAYATVSDVLVLKSTDFAFGHVTPFATRSRLDFSSYAESFGGGLGNPFVTVTPSLFFSYDATVSRSVNGVMTAIGSGLHTFNCTGKYVAFYDCGAAVSNSDPNFGLSYFQNIFAGNLQIGDEISLTLTLGSDVFVDLYNATVDPHLLSGQGSARALNSLHAYFSSSDPSAYFEAQSGHNYTDPLSIAAIPEPATSTLLSLGLVACGAVARRRRSKTCAGVGFTKA